MRLSFILKHSILLLVVSAIAACNGNPNRPSTEATTNSIKPKDSLSKNTFLPSENQYQALDISPMDMVYYPVNYPQLKLSSKLTGEKLAKPIMRIIYSRPHLHGRKLYPDIFQYNEPWRLGANEATEIQFFEPVIINKKNIAAGRYTLYAIPEKEDWVIVINKSVDDWGLKQDSTKDIERIKVPITYKNNYTEYFTMFFEKEDTGVVNLVMAWDDVLAQLPITIKK